jgi:hypothetical protein
VAVVTRVPRPSATSKADCAAELRPESRSQSNNHIRVDSCSSPDGSHPDPLFITFKQQSVAGTDTEHAANLARHRNLALTRDSRLPLQRLTSKIPYFIIDTPYFETMARRWVGARNKLKAD